MTSDRGYVLVSVVLAVGAVFMIGLGVLSRVTTEQKLTHKSIVYEQAALAARAGMEDCLGFLNLTPEGKSALENALEGQVVCLKSYSGNGVSYEAKATAIADSTPEAVSARLESVGRAGVAGAISRQVNAIIEKTPAQPADAMVKQGLASWIGMSVKFTSNGDITGNIFVNGVLDLKGNINLCGNYFATESISRGHSVDDMPGCVPRLIGSLPPVEARDLDFHIADRKAEATAEGIKIEGDWTPRCPSKADLGGADPQPGDRTPDCDGPLEAGKERVVWVTGDLLLNPYTSGDRSGIDHLDYHGNVTYIVDGNVLVNVDRIDRDAILQFMAPGIGATVEAQIGDYTQANFVVPEGTFNTKRANFTLEGLVYAGTWEGSTGKLNFQSVGRVTLDPKEVLTMRTSAYSLVQLWTQ